MKNYIDEAVVTLSDQFHGDLVPQRILNSVVSNILAEIKRLDTIKKSLFYGRENAFARQVGDDPDMSNITEKREQDILHGVIGILTEAGELMEGLSNKPDMVNIKEEIGDIFWYVAILCKVGGFTIEEVQEVNIAKLRARYPNAFTEFDANNRDLITERRILEGKQVMPVDLDK